MSRVAATRLKMNPVAGSLPVLQYCTPDQLQIDPGYQRGLESGASRALIRKIATFWDWGLCQPLIVARRADGALYVVDGQHRLAAARLRADIGQLPCVITGYRNAAEEAAAFVSLNQNRRPLTGLDIFKAALASGDREAVTIAGALEEAGLELAGSTNNQAMKINAVGNVGGMQQCLRTHGVDVLTAALDVLAQSYKDQVLRFAGSIFPGIAAIVAVEVKNDPDSWREGDMFAVMTEMVRGAEQAEWYQDILRAVSDDPNLNRRAASAFVFEKAWGECLEALFDEAAE